MHINIFIMLFVGVIGLALFLFFLIRRSFSGGVGSISFYNWGILTAIFFVMLPVGVFRFDMVDNEAPKNIESKLQQKVTFTGQIVDEPDIRENNQKLTIEISEEEEKTKLLASVNFSEDFTYGDQVQVEGILKKPENFTTDQGKEFDYINYLRKDGILYVMSHPKITIISSGNGNYIKSALFYIKGKFLEKLNFTISEPENLLMGGLILGEKSAFSEDLRAKFINTGTIHIVALSGYNVTIVAEWIMKLFNQISFVPKNMGIGIGIFSILLFVVMSGASSTAVRAGIMAVLVLVARLTGRNYDVARGLVIAGVIMILFNPYILVYDVSFQLSFIATVAVIFFTPKIEKYFLWVPKTFQIRDIVSVTAAAYIFVCPFILYKMGNLSLVALPANILILPFIPLTMLFGFLTGFIGLFSHMVAVPFGHISYLLLHYELGVVEFFARVPFAAFTIPNFPIVLTLVIYAYFMYLLFGRSIKSFFQNT